MPLYPPGCLRDIACETRQDLLPSKKITTREPFETISKLRLCWQAFPSLSAPLLLAIPFPPNRPFQRRCHTTWQLARERVSGRGVTDTRLKRRGRKWVERCSSSSQEGLMQALTFSEVTSDTARSVKIDGCQLREQRERTTGDVLRSVDATCMMLCMSPCAEE